MTEQEKSDCMVLIINELAAKIRDQDIDGSNQLVRQAIVQHDLLFGSSNRPAPASGGAVNTLGE